MTEPFADMKFRFVLSALVFLLPTVPGSVSAQAFFLDASVDQAFAPDPLSTPIGFGVAMGRTSVVGPFGVHAGLLSVYEDGADEVPQHCTFATCTPGPFRQSYNVRIVYAGLSYDFRNATDVYLNLGLNLGRTRQVESLSLVDTDQGTGSDAEEIEINPADQTTLGGSVDLRLRPLLGPLRPMFSGRYDRIFEGECALDAACLPARSVWSLSVGLSWVSPM